MNQSPRDFDQIDLKILDALQKDGRISNADLAEKADFLKVVAYNNCGGERYRRFVENVGSTVFRDVPKDELLRFNNHLLGYGEEAAQAAARQRATQRLDQKQPIN